MEDTCKDCKRSFGAIHYSDERGEMKACPGCSLRNGHHVFYLRADFRPRSKDNPNKLGSYCKGCQWGGIYRGGKVSVTPILIDCNLAAGAIRAHRGAIAKIIQALPIIGPVPQIVLDDNKPKNPEKLAKCIADLKYIKKTVVELTRNELGDLAKVFEQLGDLLTDQYAL